MVAPLEEVLQQGLCSHLQSRVGRLHWVLVIRQLLHQFVQFTHEVQHLEQTQCHTGEPAENISRDSSL